MAQLDATGTVQSAPLSPMVSFGQDQPDQTMGWYGEDQFTPPTQQVGSPDPGTAPQAWQVEDRNLWLQGLRQMQQTQDDLQQQQLDQMRQQQQQQAQEQAQFARGFYQTPGGENVANPDPLFSYIGQQTPGVQQTLYANSGEIRQRLNSGEDPQSVISDYVGNAAPAPGLAALAAQGLQAASNFTAKQLSETPIIPGVQATTYGNVASKVPGGTTALNLVGGSIPYLAASAIAPEAVEPALFGGITAVQAQPTIDAYRAGQIDFPTAAKQLALTVGPVLAPVALTYGIDAAGALAQGAKAAGMQVGDFINSPLGQRILNEERGSVGKTPEEGVPPEGTPEQPSLVNQLVTRAQQLIGKAPPSSEQTFPTTGGVPPETPDTFGQKLAQTPDPLAPVSDWLRQANVLRQSQNISTSEARAAQAARVRGVLEGGPASEETLNQALGAARGQLGTKENLLIPSEEAATALPHMLDAIQTTTVPELSVSRNPLGNMNLQNAVRDLLTTGNIPQDAQLDKLEKVFGPTIVQQIRQLKVGKGFNLADAWINAGNFSKTMKTIFPLHGMLRQGVFLAPSHPLIWLNQFLPQVKALANPEYAQALMQDISEDPWMFREDGFGFAQQGGMIHNLSESNPLARDEGVMSQWADKIPGVSRAKNSFLVFVNNFRRETYAAEAQKLYDQGVRDPNEFRALAQHINHATGWSDFNLNGLSPAVNPFFSPRRFASLIQFPADLPMQIASGNYAASKVIARDLAAFTGTATLGLGLLALGGQKAGVDPFNTDFGKAVVGNTHLDLLGGDAQIVRAVAQIMSGRRDTASGTFPVSRQSVLENFLRSKLNPVAGAVVDLYQGQNVIGQPSRTPEGMLREFTQAFSPIAGQDIYDAARESSPAGLAASTLSVLGAGAQTYQPSQGSRAGFLEQLGLGADATPQQIYEAVQQHPEARAAYDQAIQEKGGTNAAYNQRVSYWTDQQQKADAALAQGAPGAGGAWRDQYHTIQQGLAEDRTVLGVKGGGNAPDVVKNYDAIFAKYPDANTDAAQKQALTNELDQYEAGLSAQDQQTLDQYSGWGAGTTPVVREYRDTIKGLQQAGYFNLESSFLERIGQGQYQSVSELVAADVDKQMARLPASEQTPQMRQIITNAIAPQFNQIDEAVNAARLQVLRQDPQLLDEAVKFGLIRTTAALVASGQ